MFGADPRGQCVFRAADGLLVLSHGGLRRLLPLQRLEVASLGGRFVAIDLLLLAEHRGRIIGVGLAAGAIRFGGR